MLALEIIAQHSGFKFLGKNKHGMDHGTCGIPGNGAFMSVIHVNKYHTVK